MRAPWNVVLLSATAFGRSSRPTSSVTNAWRAGVSIAAPMPEISASTYTCQSWTLSVITSRPRISDDTRHDRLRDRQQDPLREAVGQHAGERRDEQERQELQAGGEAEPDAAGAEVGDHEPVLRDPLHPGAGVRDQRGDEEEPVVVDRERAERGTHQAASRSRIGTAARRTSRSSFVSSFIRCASQASRLRRSAITRVAAGLGELDHHLPPVGLVRDPTDVTGLLEAAHRARHRRRPDLLVLGEVADRHAAVPLERAHHRELVEAHRVVGALEPQPAGQPHHPEAQLAGQPGVGSDDRGRHVVSITHYLC